MVAVVTPRQCLLGPWVPVDLAAPVASVVVVSVADLEDATAASGVVAAPAAALEAVIASVDVAVVAVLAADVTAAVGSAAQVAAVSRLRRMLPMAPVVASAAVTVTVIVTGTAIAIAAGTALAEAAVGTVGVMVVAHMMTDLAAEVSAAANATLGRLAATWSPSGLENPEPQGNPETVGITAAATTTGPEITTTHPGNAGTTADTKTPESCGATRHDGCETALTDLLSNNNILVRFVSWWVSSAPSHCSQASTSVLFPFSSTIRVSHDDHFSCVILDYGPCHLSTTRRIVGGIHIRDTMSSRADVIIFSGG